MIRRLAYWPLVGLATGATIFLALTIVLTVWPGGWLFLVLNGDCNDKLTKFGKWLEGTLCLIGIGVQVTFGMSLVGGVEVSPVIILIGYFVFTFVQIWAFNAVSIENGRPEMATQK